MKTLVIKSFVHKLKNQLFNITIDDQDIEWVLDLHTEAQWVVSRNGYVIRHTHRNGEKTVHRLHRLILGLEKGDRRQSDHLDRNKLNNQRSNLVISTNAENSKNKSNINSQYTGVSLCHNRWQARISFKHRSLYLGSFENERDAALVFCVGVLMNWPENSWEAQSRLKLNLRLLDLTVQELKLLGGIR